MSEQRPAAPRDFIRGDRGPTVELTGRLARMLERHAGLDEFRRKARGQDPELDAALLALHMVALHWLGSVNGTTDAEPPEPGPSSSPWVNTGRAAARLGVTSRAVLKAIHAGHLHATRDGKSWLIANEDIEHYRAGRHRND